jgi:hypothetical protein
LWSCVYKLTLIQLKYLLEYSNDLYNAKIIVSIDIIMSKYVLYAEIYWSLFRICIVFQLSPPLTPYPLYSAPYAMQDDIFLCSEPIFTMYLLYSCSPRICIFHLSIFYFVNLYSFFLSSRTSLFASLSIR